MNTQLYNKVIDYDFQTHFKKLGYKYFTNGQYNINIIGVRAATGTKVTNRFDDVIILDYKNNKDEWCRDIYKATTEPGLYWMKALMNKKGTAIIVPDQYRSVWKFGLHKGKYKALCQRKSFRVYRDGNLDDIYDLNPKTIDEGIFGINLHKAGQDSKYVDKWSAGCQVIARERDFDRLIKTCEKQTQGDSFTYTLIREEDL